MTTLEHIGRSVWFRDYKRSNLFAMFTGYFDAAGGKDHGFTVVSGWVAPVGEWERFETDWKILLAKYSLPYFHMKEFSQSKGPFKNWYKQEGMRANFLALAVEIIACYVKYGFACHVDHIVFDKLNSMYDLTAEVGVPYSLAGRDCVAHTNQWLLDKKEELPIEFFFEAGDDGEEEFKRVMRKDGLPEPIFKPSRDREGQKGIVALQAADFAAYELRKAARDHPASDGPIWKYRKSIRALARIPAWWGQYTESDLLLLCRRIRARPREHAKEGK